MKKRSLPSVFLLLCLKILLTFLLLKCQRHHSNSRVETASRRYGAEGCADVLGPWSWVQPGNQWSANFPLSWPVIQSTVKGSLPWTWMHFPLCLMFAGNDLHPNPVQVPLSMGLPRQEYWTGLPFPSPGDLPDPGLNSGLLHCRWILYCLSHQRSPTLPQIRVTSPKRLRYGLSLECPLNYIGTLPTPVLSSMWDQGQEALVYLCCIQYTSKLKYVVDTEWMHWQTEQEPGNSKLK